LGTGALTSRQQLPGSTRKSWAGLSSSWNWTQECTDQNLDQDHRENNEQDPLQKAAMKEESETLMIPQL